MRKLLLITLPFLFSFSTCGHRGSPKPPLTKIPATPQVENLIQDYDRPLISWKRVKNYRDGRKLPVPEKVEYAVIINFGKRKVKTKKNYLIDSPIRPGEKRCYSVASVYEGKWSSPTEPVCIKGKEPIPEIPLFSLKGEDGRVVIELKNPKLPVEVFRNAKPPYIKPDATFSGKTFVDRNVKNGKPYTYRLRFADGELKGKLSQGKIVIPEDREPPLPPPHAYLIEGKTCTAVWEPSPSEDVVYYEVVAGNSTFKVSGIYFNLPECFKNVRVVAVDKAGNRSKPVEAEVVK